MLGVFLEVKMVSLIEFLLTGFGFPDSNDSSSAERGTHQFVSLLFSAA